jgi:signal transduction histidine kinase
MGQFESIGNTSGDVVASLAHDLRSPLNSIIGFSSLLREHKVDPASPEHDEFLDHVLTSARELLQLINDLIDFSVVDGGRMEFFPQPTDLDRVTIDALAALKPLTAAKHIAVHVALAPGASDVFLDSLRLSQVLRVFLGNAVAATPEEGRIDVRCVMEDPHHVRLEVENTGAEIGDADAATLFESFRPTGSQPRAGLPLKLVRRMVEAQGGRAGAASVAGRGTTTLFAVLPKYHRA